MAAVASLEELNAVAEDLNRLRAAHPEAYEETVKVFKTHRKVGYKNICKIMMGEATPEKLKGLGSE